MRGDSFPHADPEEQAKEFIQTQKERLLAVSTVAFFGLGITFSAIFSGTRGSIGLMSYSWAAFAVSFSLSVFIQWTNPPNPPYSVVTYPGIRTGRFRIIFAAAFASFVGIILMAVSVAMLTDGRASDIDARIIPSGSGIISLLPVVLGFICGTLILLWNGVRKSVISAKR
ncbi:hypothetical protein GYMLUDRAFT_912445 [Collybiopsis luxurians FD-317 M1]|nr:hypothetical protein GYMLUDRAFT_912445 [Collybiopsis luxurians FD-317 M1]